MDRRPRLSSAQWEQLVGFLEQNPQVARGFSRSTQARQQALRMWEQLAVLLNSEGEGITKDAKSWSKFWNDYKCKLKKKVQDIRISMQGTGGGPAFQEILSNIEIRLLAVLGENFGGQLEGVAVEPFPPENQILVQEPIVFDNQNILVEGTINVDNQNILVEGPINVLTQGFDERREEAVQCASSEGPPADQPPADPPSPSALRVSRRRSIRQRRTHQRSRPQTAFDDAHKLLADIEAKRVEAEQMNATSLAEMVKLLSRKISIDERAVAVQEELGRQVASAINGLAESIKALTERGHELAKDVN